MEKRAFYKPVLANEREARSKRSVVNARCCSRCLSYSCGSISLSAVKGGELLMLVVVRVVSIVLLVRFFY